MYEVQYSVQAPIAWPLTRPMTMHPINLPAIFESSKSKNADIQANPMTSAPNIFKIIRVENFHFVTLKFNRHFTHLQHIYQCWLNAKACGVLGSDSQLQKSKFEREMSQWQMKESQIQQSKMEMQQLRCEF